MKVDFSSFPKNSNCNFLMRSLAALYISCLYLIKETKLKIVKENSKNVRKVQIKELIIMFNMAGFCTFTIYVLDPDLYLSYGSDLTCELFLLN